MFLVDCPECGRRALYGAGRVWAVWTIAPGVLLVELTCYRGHSMIVLTGRAAAFRWPA